MVIVVLLLAAGLALGVFVGITNPIVVAALLIAAIHGAAELWHASAD